MNDQHFKKTSCLIAFCASAFQAFGMYNIHAVSGITEGGVLGAILLIHHWLKISPSVSSLVLNLLCYFLGWKIYGKTFLAYSFAAVLGFSASYALCEFFPPLFPEIAYHPLFAALLGSIFVGIGSGLTVRVGGATSGDDAFAMSLSRISGIPIQWIYLFSDFCMLGLSLSYIPIYRIGYSLLTVVLSGQIIGLLQKTPKP